MTEFFKEVEKIFEETDKIREAVLNDFFGKPKKIKFNTYVYDMRPNFWKKTDDGYTCLVHTLGLKPEDIKITIKEDCINVNGETKYNELDDLMTKDIDIPVDKDIMSNVTKVRYRTENGLTFIYLDVEHKENKIKIERI